MTGQLRMILLLVVTVGCLVFALWGIELDKVQAALVSIRWPLLLGVLALLVGQFFLRVWRFQILLGPERPSWGRQVVVSAIGFMAINVMPLRMGEVARPWLLTQDDVPMGHSFGAVAVERVLDLLMLLGLLSVVAFVLDMPSETILVQGIDILAASQKAIGTVLLVAVVVMAVLALGGTRAAKLMAGIPKIGPKVLRFAKTFRSAAMHLVVRPAQGTTALLLSVVIWIAAIAQTYVLLWAFPEVPHTATVATAVATMTFTGVITIPTPGFFGPFEVFCKAVLVLWAVDPDVATTFAVVWHLHIFAFNLVPGLAFMVRDGLSMHNLVQSSRAKSG